MIFNVPRFKDYSFQYETTEENLSYDSGIDIEKSKAIRSVHKRNYSASARKRPATTKNLICTAFDVSVLPTNVAVRDSPYRNPIAVAKIVASRNIFGTDCSPVCY
jgi:hypothetical protein